MSSKYPIYESDNEGNEIVTILAEDYNEYITLSNRRDRDANKIKELQMEITKLNSSFVSKQKPKDKSKQKDIEVEGNPFGKRNISLLGDNEKEALAFVSDFMNKNGSLGYEKYEILFNLRLGKEYGATMRELMRSRLRIFNEEQILSHIEELKSFGVRKVRTAARGRPRVAWVWDQP